MATKPSARKTGCRVACISDLHCGHGAGLTPPDWQSGAWAGASRARVVRAAQAALWDEYARIAREEGADVLVVDGDATDGPGKQTGEHITRDVIEQAAMAVECINVWRGAEVYMAFGTPFHVSADGNDIERVIADQVGAREIGGHLYLDVHGVMFDVKHKVGSSSVPHGRHTSLARERLWQQLWSEYGQPRGSRGDVLIRGHVHYHSVAGGSNWVAMTLPALQGLGSKYGVRECSGVVDWGLVIFDVQTDGRFSWRAHTVRGEGKSKATTVRS